MSEEGEYVLGTDPVELERLRYQHLAWIEQTLALYRRAGIGAGQTVLDLGCGPGYTSIVLAEIVGSEGRVIARDVSSRFLRFLESERGRRGLEHLEISLGPVEELVISEGTLDAAYARWIFCWLAEPRAAMERVARALRSGGVLAIQEYIDWGAMKLIPRSVIFDRVVEACLESWRFAGATIDIGEHLPDLAEHCGLDVEWMRPVSRIGGPGSLEWGWLGGFFRGYLGKVVDLGLLGRDERDEFSREWDSRSRRATGYCYTPTLVEALLRKP